MFSSLTRKGNGVLGSRISAPAKVAVWDLMAAMLGALPLAIGYGEGAELRRPLGIAIVGGLVVSQPLTLYTTPVIYLYLDRFRLWLQQRWAGGRLARRPGRLAEPGE